MSNDLPKYRHSAGTRRSTEFETMGLAAPLSLSESRLSPGAGPQQRGAAPYGVPGLAGRAALSILTLKEVADEHVLNPHAPEEAGLPSDLGQLPFCLADALETLRRAPL